jgi:L-2-hydroxyglutarate oxidase
MNYDIIIIGGGIVGLATAFRIKESNPLLKIALIEKEKELAVHQTGSNSGVIHSGIYYKPGSLKAKNCLEGYRQLIEFCYQNDIKYEICGKIIVATHPDELPGLEDIYQRGLQNGLSQISKIQKEQLKDFEPYVTGLAGVRVPYTGIIDYRAVCIRLSEIFTEFYQGEIFLGQKVIDIKNNANDSEIVTTKQSFTTKLVVNCAGLFSDKIAAINNKKLDVRIIPFRGEYFILKPEKQGLVRNLIYPVPNPAFPFLGVHFTRMIKGSVEAGPNAVFALKREGYKKTDISITDTFESLAWKGYRKVMMKYWKIGLYEYFRSFSKSAFTKALQRLIPVIQKDDLLTGGAGVRAMACDRNGGLIDDFLIDEDKYIINILNAPSPAATASLSIGKTIAKLVLKRF